MGTKDWSIIRKKPTLCQSDRLFIYPVLRGQRENGRCWALSALFSLRRIGWKKWKLIGFNLKSRHFIPEYTAGKLEITKKKKNIDLVRRHPRSCPSFENLLEKFWPWWPKRQLFGSLGIDAVFNKHISIQYIIRCRIPFLIYSVPHSDLLICGGV